MNSKGSVVQSSRRASTTSRCPMNRIGLRFPVPWKRTTRFFLRSFGPATWMSLSAKPPSRRRAAIASAAAVTLPTESVVLISMSCLKISRANCFVCSCPCAETADEQFAITQNNRTQCFTACIWSPQNEFHGKGGEDRKSGSVRPHQRRWQTRVHEPGQLARPLEDPIQPVERNQMKPGRAQRLHGISACCRERENDMKFVDANHPINQTDEICEKQIQRRDQQRFFGKLGVQRDSDDFRNQRGHAKKIADPNARKRRQCLRLRLLSLGTRARPIHSSLSESALAA